ncbi:PhzF family phenazine biosynthesis protein [Solwaraspora sp. WMMD1047]|uniref:PhzF family phenazine biosynthesis protein n=1 Tax=Solwaraspora sp. WMMD1047 TaxID=3016102 RepID=UPI0024175AFF|nr:PhzF family phenazine biosynthesis protein [Solwaraspora sp. WMMD1047]MDG4830786.1 PhzF family phenazine biosynthesis protein [Solwaraspora sp. WMMD1047]
MRIRLVQIDAFADRPFEGNPAAVMPLPWWLPDALLHRIAAENNLSETAFYTDALPAGVDRPDGSDGAYHLRWFTPAVEVDLCGHATLAAAGQLFDDRHPDGGRLSFWTRSGWLHVRRGDRDGLLVLDFPAEPLTPVPAGDPLLSAASTALGVTTPHALRGTDLFLVLPEPAAVRAVTPDFSALARLPIRGVAVAAPGDGTGGGDGGGSGGDGFDFVSRWFGGNSGVGEDPVTGSAHSQLAPYWAARLGRRRLTARQLSARGGTVVCEVDGDRVRLAGTYHRYLDGMVTIYPDGAATQ